MRLYGTVTGTTYGRPHKRHIIGTRDIEEAVQPSFNWKFILITCTTQRFQS